MTTRKAGKRAPRTPAADSIDGHGRVKAGLDALRARLKQSDGAGGKPAKATPATKRQRADIDTALRQLDEAYARLLGR